MGSIRRPPWSFDRRHHTQWDIGVYWKQHSHRESHGSTLSHASRCCRNESKPWSHRRPPIGQWFDWLYRQLLSPWYPCWDCRTRLRIIGRWSSTRWLCRTFVQDIRVDHQHHWQPQHHPRYSVASRWTYRWCRHHDPDFGSCSLGEYSILGSKRRRLTRTVHELHEHGRWRCFLADNRRRRWILRIQRDSRWEWSHWHFAGNHRIPWLACR